jgi:hypothetical protein
MAQPQFDGITLEEHPLRKKLVTTVAVATFAGLGAGFAIGTPSLVGAQTAGSDTTVAGATKPARADYVNDALKKLVADGTINQTQADAVAKAIKDARPADGAKGGPGMRGGRPGGQMGGMGGGMIAGGMNLVDAAAKALGITTHELITQVKDGTTVAKIAESKGVALNTVVDAVVKAMSTKIDEAVTAGKLTQADADAKKASLTKIVTDFANGTMPTGPMGAGSPGGRGPRGKGPIGQAKPNAPTTTTTVAGS